MKKFVLSLIIAINLVLSPVASAEECPLCYAAARGDLSEVKRLLDNGARTNFLSKSGNTALIAAARFGHSEVVKLLLENRANVNAVSIYGRTALIIAAKHGHSEVAKLLLENGANTDAVEIGGWTALMFSALEGHSEVVKLLLENGVNVNALTTSDSTALIWAAYKGYTEIATILLQCGANPDIRDKEGDSAWDYAQDKPLMKAIFLDFINKVSQGRRFPPCDKVAENKQNKNQPDFGGGIEAKKLPKESNIAERVFENTWRSVVFIENENSQGSGVIIDANIVATNCHVVENSYNIQVYKSENRQANRDIAYNATIIKQDDKNDFCLLSVDNLWGIAAKVRKYNTINIGEDVYALGAPQGLDLSLSTGIVSQLRQSGGERLIQTDTAISPGSSGGGLFDSESNLIGILTSKIVKENVEGIGFAIPADLAL